MASIVVKRVKGIPYCYHRQQRRIGGKVRPKDTILFCCDPCSIPEKVLDIHIAVAKVDPGDNDPFELKEKTVDGALQWLKMFSDIRLALKAKYPRWHLLRGTFIHGVILMAPELRLIHKYATRFDWLSKTNSYPYRI